MKMLKNYLLGIDLGGTQLRFILADNKTGNIVKKKSYISPLSDKEDFFEHEPFIQIPKYKKISAYVNTKLLECFESQNINFSNISAIGISVAGKIQKDNRFIGSNVPLKYATKIGKYYGVDIITDLKKLFSNNIKIVIENDGNCSGWAQGLYYKHIGIDPYTTFYITISTGIGGGGYKRDMDEIGHIAVDGHFPGLIHLCGCGAKACIETYASGEGIKNQTLNILDIFFNNKFTFDQLNTFEYIRSRNKYNLKDIVNTSKLKQLYIENKKISPKEIFTLANIDNSKTHTDKFAYYIVESAAEKIAKVLISLSNIHGLERFGFGGGVIFNNPKFLDIIQQKIRLIYKSSEDILKKSILLEISPLGEYIGDYGALLLVLEPIYENNWFNIIENLSAIKK